MTDKQPSRAGAIIAVIVLGWLTVGGVITLVEKAQEPPPWCSTLADQEGSMPPADTRCRDDDGSETSFEQYFVSDVREQMN